MGNKMILNRKEQKREMERLVNNMWAKFYQEAYFDYSKIDYEVFCRIAELLKPAMQAIIDREFENLEKNCENSKS